MKQQVRVILTWHKEAKNHGGDGGDLDGMKSEEKN